MLGTTRQRAAGLSILASAVFAVVPAPAAQASTIAGWTPGTVFVADQGLHSGNGRVYAIPPGSSPYSIYNGVSPTDVAVDPSGNVFIPDCNNGNVVEVPPGGGSPTAVASSLNCPDSVALDNSGNLLVGDFNHIWSYVVGGPRTLLVDGQNAQSLAVDGNSNVFFTDGGGHLDVLLGGSGSPLRIVGEPYDGSIARVRLDSSGAMFVSTSFYDVAARLPVSSGSATTYGTGLGYVAGAAVDSGGNVYATSQGGSGEVVEVSGGTTTPIATGLDTPQGLAVFPPIAVAARGSSNVVLTSPTPSNISTQKSVRLHAAVSGAGTPNGFVQFYANNGPLGAEVATTSAGATLDTMLPAGTDSVTALFLGDGSNNLSRSNPLTFSVVKVASLTTTSSSSPSTLPQDQQVAITATVTGRNGPPTGSVEFKVDGRTVDTQSLNSSGVATSSFFLPPGTHNVKAVYDGDTTFAGSSGNALTFTTTAPYQSSIARGVTYSNPSADGSQKVWITVSVTGQHLQGAPTGTVTASGGFACTPLSTPGSGITAKSVCSTRVPNSTFETVTITYSGDSVYDPSSTQAFVDVCNSPCGSA